MLQKFAAFPAKSCNTIPKSRQQLTILSSYDEEQNDKTFIIEMRQVSTKQFLRLWQKETHNHSNKYKKKTSNIASSQVIQH